jgi:hypothetical protein
MHHSHVIEVAGQFAGAAVAHQNKFRFVAVDPRVEELDDSLWPSLPDVQRVVGHLMTTGRLPPAPSHPSRSSAPGQSCSAATSLAISAARPSLALQSQARSPCNPAS